MKKLLSIVALLSITPAFAAHNTFTFDVISIGQAYICGVQFSNMQTILNGGLGGHRDTISWTEEYVDEWTGESISLEEKNSSKLLLGSKGDLTFTIGNFLPELGFIEPSNDRTHIKNLKIDLDGTSYGAVYQVQVCYDIPIYYDLNAIEVDVQSEVSFTNQVKGKDYIKNAVVKSKIRQDLYGYPIMGQFLDERRVDVANGHAAAGFHLLTDPMEGASKYTVVSTFEFLEDSKAARPAGEHAGHFALTSNFEPVDEF